MANDTKPRDALNYFAEAAKRVLPLSEIQNFNAAFGALDALITDREAAERVKAEVQKSDLGRRETGMKNRG